MESREQPVLDVMREIGELYLGDAFARTCDDPALSGEFEAGLLERDVANPRMLVNPAALDASNLTVECLSADLDYLRSLVESNPEAFEELRNSLGDARSLRRVARRMGLTEQSFQKAGGGLGWLLLVPLVLVLGGCGSDDEDEDPSGLPPNPPEDCSQPQRWILRKGTVMTKNPPDFATQPGVETTSTDEFLEWEEDARDEADQRMQAMVTAITCREPCEPEWEPDPDSVNWKIGSRDQGGVRRFWLEAPYHIRVKCVRPA